MTNFEEKLKALEELTDDIKRSDISLEDALKDFEEGIKIAKNLEKQLDKMESKIQILMNSPENAEADPQMELFKFNDEITGTRS
ncbi:MAG: exodeoxyribonuclease VII small subunit [Treponema sp.]|nr:exodeoxyribonuclease VII small subunit [Treponema sp.]